MASFTIPGRLPSLNQQFRVPKYRFGRSRERQAQKRYVAGWILASGVPKFEAPVDVRIRWIEKDRRRDYDNISSGAKIVLDALVATARIPSDSRRWVWPVVHEFEIDPKSPRIEVTIEEHKGVAGPSLSRSARSDV